MASTHSNACRMAEVIALTNNSMLCDLFSVPALEYCSRTLFLALNKYQTMDV